MNEPAEKAPTNQSSRPGRSFVLRFISGKYQGGEFPIVADKQIIVGRSSDLDMVLVEDMVSRKHARIAMQGDQIWIEDLGSTNGTFVNGEKIKKARLKEGDRILIGTSIIKLVSVDPASQVSEAEAKNQLEKRGQQSSMKTTSTSRAMSGSIEEIPLPDLLQLLSTSKRTGVLSLRGPTGNGQIFLRKGQIYYATVDDSYDMNPRKAAYRLLTWDRGTFELDSAEEKTFSAAGEASTFAGHQTNMEAAASKLKTLVTAFDSAKQEMADAGEALMAELAKGGKKGKGGKQVPDYGEVALLASDRFGYRAMAGGVEGFQVTEPSFAYNPTRMLVLQTLAAEAAAHVVAQDFAAAQGERRLLQQIDEADTSAPAVRAQIVGLYARVLGEAVTADSAEVDAAHSLFTRGLQDGPRRAWTLVIAALLQDPQVAYH